MAIGPGFYNEADQKLYEDFQYLPQEQYRLGLGNNNQVNRLDFSNLSNSGIMSQAPVPYIYPPINQGGGGGGGGFDVTESIDQSTTSDDFGFGLEGNDPSMNMTEEEQEAIDNINNPTFNKAALAKIGLSSFFGPFSMMGTAYREQKKAEAQALEQAQQAATAARAAENKAAGRGGYQSDFAQDSGFMDGPSGAGYGMGAADKGGSDTMGSSKDGGIMGYGGKSGTPKGLATMFVEKR